MRKTFYLLLFLFSFHNYISAQSNSGSVSMTEASIDKKLDDIAKVSKAVFEPKYEPVLLKLKSESEKLKYDLGVLRSGDYLMAFYLGKGEDKKTIELASELKKIAKDKKDIYGHISGIYRKSALALGYLGLNDESLKDFQKSISHAKEIENNDRRRKLLSFAYENITVYYESVGTQSADDSIFSNYKKSLEMAKMISDKNDEVPIDQKYDLIAYTNMCLGVFYLEHEGIKGYLDSAEKYLLDAQKIYEDKKFHIDPTNKAQTFNELSRLYIAKKEYQKAINYAKGALAYEKQHSYPFTRRQSFEYLLQAYLEIGDNENSKFYRNKFTKLNDSLDHVKKQEVNTTMKKMVSEVKDEHKEDSKKQFIIIGILIVTAVAGAIILWRRNNKKLHKKYEQIIEKLEEAPIAQKKQTNNTKKGEISNETEERIMNQLEAFENSEEFLRKDLTISLLSSQLNTNSKYLSDIIKNKKSHNFSSYINHLKINYIVHKLYNEPKYRDYKITHLAEICGYASPQAFFVAFKKINEVTPAYFIQKLNEEDNI